MEFLFSFFSEALSNNTSVKIINILSIGFVTMTILWILSFLKSKKLKAKIKHLENKL